MIFFHFKIRTQETNLGNLVCDIVLTACNAQISLINSGTFRSHMIHPAGDFKAKDLKSIIPFLEEICVISVSGIDHILKLINLNK